MTSHSIIRLLLIITIIILGVIILNLPIHSIGIPSSNNLDDLPVTMTPAVKPPFDPAHYGVPDTLGGYTVLGIFTRQEIACVPPGERRIILQASQGNIHDFLEQAQPITGILEFLQQISDDMTSWQVSVVGPHTTLEKILSNIKSWNETFENRPCMNLGGPAVIATHTEQNE